MPNLTAKSQKRNGLEVRTPLIALAYAAIVDAGSGW